MGNRRGQGEEKESSGRRERLAEALRANLKRRKARERQRTADGNAGGSRNDSKESG